MKPIFGQKMGPLNGSPELGVRGFPVLETKRGQYLKKDYSESLQFFIVKPWPCKSPWEVQFCPRDPQGAEK